MEGRKEQGKKEWGNKEKKTLSQSRKNNRVRKKQLPFCTHHGNNGFSQVSLMNTNSTGWKFDEKWVYDIISKHLLMNYLLIPKKK